MTDGKKGNGCPCRGCADRVPEPNCHGRCERYREWKAMLDERNRVVREHKQKNNTMSADKLRTIWNNKRYSRQVRYNKSNKAD